MKASQTALTFSVYPWVMKPERTELIGTEIKRLRKQRGYSQKELGDLVGLSNKRISQIEKEQNLDGLSVGYVRKLGGILKACFYIEPAKVKPPELEG